MKYKFALPFADESTASQLAEMLGVKVHPPAIRSFPGNIPDCYMILEEFETEEGLNEFRKRAYNPPPDTA